jgi:dihydroflavonol-4-reductase
MGDVAWFADTLDGVDVVFHTAAYSREYYTPGDHSEIVVRFNAQATMELARAAEAPSVRKIIHTSSAGIIPLRLGGSPRN